MKNILSIHAPLPIPTYIKQRWIFFGLGLFLMLMLIAFYKTMHHPSPNTSPSPFPIFTSTIASIKIDKWLDVLPDNYKEIDKIKPLLFQDSKINDTQILKQKIEDLEHIQNSLQHELKELKHTQSIPVQPTSLPPDEKISEAQKSPLFFQNTEPNFSQMFVETDPNKPSQETNLIKISEENKPIREHQSIDLLNETADQNEIYDAHRITTPMSPYEIQAGTLLHATLITGINTSLSGQIVAQISQDIYDSVKGKYLLIPIGSKLIGQYDSQIAYGQTRILIAFERIIRPDGSSILFEKINGSDLQGQSGIEAHINNHWSRILGAATISTLLSVGTGIASDNVGKNNLYYRDAKQNAILAAAQNISETGQSLSNKAINIQPTLSLPAGYPFNVIVRKDLILTPYFYTKVASKRLVWNRYIRVFQECSEAARSEQPEHIKHM